MKFQEEKRIEHLEIERASGVKIKREQINEDLLPLWDKLSQENQQNMAWELMNVHITPSNIGIAPAIIKTVIQNERIDDIEKKYSKMTI